MNKTTELLKEIEEYPEDDVIRAEIKGRLDVLKQMFFEFEKLRLNVVPDAKEEDLEEAYDIILKNMGMIRKEIKQIEENGSTN